MVKEIRHKEGKNREEKDLKMLARRSTQSPHIQSPTQASCSSFASNCYWHLEDYDAEVKSSFYFLHQLTAGLV